MNVLKWNQSEIFTLVFLQLYPQRSIFMRSKFLKLFNCFSGVFMTFWTSFKNTLLNRSVYGMMVYLRCTGNLIYPVHKRVFFFKDSVQQKLSCVKNCTKRGVRTWDRGAGHYFLKIVSLQLVLSIFPFLVAKAILASNFYPICEAWWILFHASPIFSYPVLCADTFGAAILTLLSCKAQQIQKSQIVRLDAANAPPFAFKRGNCAPLCFYAQGTKPPQVILAAYYILRQYYWCFF